MSMIYLEGFTVKIISSILKSIEKLTKLSVYKSKLSPLVIPGRLIMYDAAFIPDFMLSSKEHPKTYLPTKPKIYAISKQ